MRTTNKHIHKRVGRGVCRTPLCLYFKASIRKQQEHLKKPKRKISPIKNIITWVLWDFLGFRAVFEKGFPPKDISTGTRKPATLMLWLSGIYITMYGVAFQNYEKQSSSINNQIEVINNLIVSPYYKFALSKIPGLQNSMMIPAEPKLLSPKSVISSLIGPHEKPVHYGEAIKNIVEVCKDSLDYIHFEKIDISLSNLNRSNMKYAYMLAVVATKTTFVDANLEHAQFFESDLSYCVFSGANMRKAWLCSSNLTGANFMGSDLRDCKLLHSNVANANFMYASFVGADIRGIKNYTIEQFSSAHSLYNSIMDPSLESQLRGKYPELFEKPVQETVKMSFIGYDSKH